METPKFMILLYSLEYIVLFKDNYLSIRGIK